MRHSVPTYIRSQRLVPKPGQCVLTRGENRFARANQSRKLCVASCSLFFQVYSRCKLPTVCAIDETVCTYQTMHSFVPYRRLSTGMWRAFVYLYQISSCTSTVQPDSRMDPCKYMEHYFNYCVQTVMFYAKYSIAIPATRLKAVK